MAMNFQQTDGLADASALASLCSGASLNTDKDGRTALTADAAGAIAVTTTVDISAADLASVWFELTVPAGSTWGAGDWTVRLNVTSGNPQLTWDAVHVCRVNSAYVNQASIGSAVGLAHNLTTPGVFTATVTGAAQTPAADDKVVCVLLFDNASSMAASAFQWTPDQIITAAGFLPPAGGVNAPVSRMRSVSLRRR